jgi:glyoxylate carboligase
MMLALYYVHLAHFFACLFVFYQTAGGQSQHGLQEQADSCFATVVDGKDTLQRIFNQEIYPRGNEYAYFFQDPIEIVQARVLEPRIDLNGIAAAAAAAAKPKIDISAAVQRAKKLPQRVDVNQETRDEKRWVEGGTALPAEGIPRENAV